VLFSWHTSIGTVVAVVEMICRDLHHANLVSVNLTMFQWMQLLLERISITVDGDLGKNNIITTACASHSKFAAHNY
jgi:hypothetical protein